jgi:hypothetical protein
MLVQSVDTSTPVGICYVAMWSYACASTALATVLCVFMIVVTTLTQDEAEYELFLALYSYPTYGIGPHTQLILFYSGCLTAITGLVLYSYIAFEFHAFLFALGTFAAAGFLFLNSMSLMVSSLYGARQTGHFIHIKLQPLILSKEEIIENIKQFEILCEGPENLPDVTPFVKFIQEKYHSKLSVITAKRVNYEYEKNLNMIAGIPFEDN